MPIRSQTRPVVALESEPILMMLDAIAVGALLFMLAVVAVHWVDVPERVPVHFGAAGRPDSWGGKGSLLILPITSLGMFAIFTLVSRFPQTHNYAWPITEENAERQYRLARRLLAALKSFLTVMFAVIVWGQVQIARGESTSLGAWFVTVFLGGLLLIIGGYFWQAWRAR